MTTRILPLLLATALAAKAGFTLFTSNFNANTGAHVFTGAATDNAAGSSSLGVTWTKHATVTAISGLTAISTDQGATVGGFAQLNNGTATYANPDCVYMSRNNSWGNNPRKRGFSLTFTLDTPTYLGALTVLSGHATNKGADEANSSNLVYQLSGGTLATPLTGTSARDYANDPAYHSVVFDLAATPLGAGTYTLQVYQTGTLQASYAIYDGITLTAGTPAIPSFTADKPVVAPGSTVNLSWQTTGATSLAIDQGVGSVTTIATNGAGSIPVVINQTTTFTLTATNPAGTTTRQLLVTAAPPKPNILLVLVDDMGTEDSSVNFNYDPAGNPLPPIDPVTVGLPAFTDFPGNSHFRTPNMEALAANGMKFTRAYACQVCSPTRCSILTGQNSARHGTVQYLGTSGGGTLFNLKPPPYSGLLPANRTLAEVLRDAGYRTIISGKGHLGDAYSATTNNYVNPATPANDYYGFQINVSASSRGQHGRCYASANPAYGLTTSGTGTAVTNAFVAEYQGKTYRDIDPVAFPTGAPFANESVFITEAVTREMNDRIATSVSQGKPFFAYMSHFAVHDPHEPDPRFTANYPGLTGDTLDFATMVEGMDQSLGDMITKLDQLGVAENTLVIFLGDNGSDSKPRGQGNPATLGMSNPLRGDKGMRYEGGIRVPLLISWAKRDASNPFQQALDIPAASRESDLVAVEDIFPTILAACGVPVPATNDAGAPLVIDGRDLAPYLRGVPGTHRPQQLVTHAPAMSRNSFFTTYHEGMWKLIYNHTTSSPDTSTHVPLGSYELYNLASDPHEANNLAATEPARVMSMARSLVAELERLGAPYPQLIASDPDFAALGLPFAPNDPHPVILPLLPTVDTDGDGLPDNTEDPNRNGIRTPTETDAANPNTDGDTTNDGAEIRTGTDPLNATSDFRGVLTPTAGGPMTLTWPSKPGVSYEIRTTTDLAVWSPTPLATVPASAGTTTSYQLPVTSATRLFYRIQLLP